MMRQLERLLPCLLKGEDEHTTEIAFWDKLMESPVLHHYNLESERTAFR